MLLKLDQNLKTVLQRLPLPAPAKDFLAKPYAALVAAGGLVALGVLGWYFFGVSGTAEVAIATRGKAIAAVYGTVSVDPAQQVVLKSKTVGVLSDLKVKEGEAVKKGQALGKINDEILERQLDLATKELERSRVKQEIGPASAPDLKTKEDSMPRLKRLLDAQNISQAEYDREQNQYKALQDKLKNEKIELDQQVETAQSKLTELKSLKDNTTFITPIDGKVLNIYVDLGQTINANEQVIRIGSSANQITASVNEEDVGALKSGQKAMVRFYSKPGEDTPATLQEVLPKTVDQSYQVLFKLDQPMQGLLPGMTGEMNIITGERENALMVPSRAVRNGNQVLEVKSGKVFLRKISIGFRGVEKTEVEAGLADGSLVIVNDQDLFRPGMRVRTVLMKPKS